MIQFIKFCLIGVLNTGIDFLLYGLLTRVFDVFFLLANIISVVVAMTFSFFANKTITFKNKETGILKQYSKFVFINTFGLILNNIILFIGVRVLNLNDLLAKFGAIVLTLVVNFIGMKYWAFATKK